MARPLHLLRIIPSMDPQTGGPVEGIARMTAALSRDGHRTEVVCLDPPDAEWLEQDSIAVHTVGRGVGKFALSVPLLRWLQREVPRFDCAIVHGTWQFTGMAAWLTSRRFATPYFVYPHGMLDPWFNANDRLKHLKKIAYWSVAERHVLAAARAVLYTCEREMSLARTAFPGYRCRDISVGYGTSRPPTDEHRQIAAFVGAFPALAGRRFVLSLARLHPKKGHDVLIEAFANVRDVDSALQLVIAGPDANGLRRSLEALAGKRGVAERVHFIGMIQGDAKWGALRSCELLALPSHQENFGISIVEALACGVPVLISERVNISDEIALDGAGFVGRDDVPATEESLRRWISASEIERTEMGARAQACFDARFDIDRVARRFVDILSAHGVSART